MEWITDGSKPPNGLEVLVYFRDADEMLLVFWSAGQDRWILDDGPAQLPDAVDAWALLPDPPRR